MLNTLHDSLQVLLRSSGRIDAVDADVSFERPSEEWVASLTYPTIDFFLFDVRENTDKRETDMRLRFENGRAKKQLPPRPIDLWYMVSVLATEIADEHELLWRALSVLLKHEEWPAELLPEGVRAIAGSVRGRLATDAESRNLLDIWSAIGAKPRPALCYVLTTPLDVATAIESPLVLTRTARHQAFVPELRTRTTVHIGGVVRDGARRPLPGVRVSPVGSARVSVTDMDGRYRLHSLPEGRRRLSLVRDGHPPREVEFTVPAESYDIVLEG